MLRHRNIDRICCIILALTLLVSALYVGAAAGGIITGSTEIGYESRLFDQSRVHTIDIVMDDWDAFLDTATTEEYSACHLVIDGESYKNVAIRGKGNTSLSSVQSYGNDRYSFKVEFDHYQSGSTYHGLDKLSLNNLIQDNTYLKDYFAYTLMNQMGVAAPLCSFVQVNVNGEAWGLYLAVEGVEDAFLQRNYGKNHGELYKPDSMSFGGGRGNGAGFDMEALMENFEGFEYSGEAGSFTMPDMSGSTLFEGFELPEGFEIPEGFDPSQMMGSFGGSSGESATSAEPAVTASPTPAPTAEPTGNASSGESSGMPAGGEAPAMPTGGDMPAMPAGGNMPGGYNPSQMAGSFGGSSSESAASAEPAVTASPTPAPTAEPTSNASSGESSGMPAGGEAPAMPTGGDMPAMPAGGNMPGGYEPSQMMGSFGDSSGESAASTEPAVTATPVMPTDGDMPDAAAVPGERADGQPTRGNEQSGRFERGNREGFGGMGGMGGMGSNDVKLQYTDDDPASYENIFNNAKTDVTDADKARLIAALKALGEGDLSAVDTDAVLRYMAVHNFLCNDDSYTGTIVHNYYLYEEDGTLAMIPWDYNLTFGTMTGGSDATSSVNADIDTLVRNGSSGDRPMADWITASEETLAQYHAVYAKFVADVFESGWFEGEIDRVIAMISPYVEADPTAFCTYEEFLTGAETLKAFCLKRAQSVRSQLDGSDATVDASGLSLSAMGSMGNMGGGMDNMGGMGGQEFTERIRSRFTSGTESADATAPEPSGDATTPDASGNSLDFSSSGSSSSSSAEPTATPAMSEAPAGDMPTGGMPAGKMPMGDVPADGMPTGNMPMGDVPTDGMPTGNMPMSDVPTDGMPTGDVPVSEGAAVSASPVQPAFGGSGMRGVSGSTGTANAVPWLIVCVVVLAAALIFAKCYPSRR